MLLIAFLAAAALAAASAAAFYSYGRFARHALGEPGRASPADGPPTALDRIITPLIDAHPGATGILLDDSNRESFELRALCARDAGRGLDLQDYIWKDDQQGRLLVREVLLAAGRGVRVRVLLDDNNARGKDRAILALDSHAHIEVRLFNPARNREGSWGRAAELRLRAVSLNRRMHNKAWIADGRAAIVGGRNIGDEFWNSGAVIPIRALHRLRRRRRDRLLPRMRAALESLARAAADSPWLGRMSDPAWSLAARTHAASRLVWSTGVQVAGPTMPKGVAAYGPATRRRASGAARSCWPLAGYRSSCSCKASSRDVAVTPGRGFPHAVRRPTRAEGADRHIPATVTGRAGRRCLPRAGDDCTGSRDLDTVAGFRPRALRLQPRPARAAGYS